MKRNWISILLAVCIVMQAGTAAFAEEEAAVREELEAVETAAGEDAGEDYGGDLLFGEEENEPDAVLPGAADGAVPADGVEPGDSIEMAEESEDPEDSDFWDSLFEEEEIFEGEKDPADDVDIDLAEEGIEEADDPVELEDATVVPDNTVSTSAGARRIMRAPGAGTAVFNGSFGNQLSGAAAIFYQNRVEHYATGHNSGQLTMKFDKDTTPLTFHATVYLNENGERKVDTTTEEYLNYKEQVKQAMQEAGDAFLYDHSEVFWVRGGIYTPTYTAYKDSDGNWIGYYSKIVFTPVESFPGAADLISSFDAAVAETAANIRAGADYDADGQTDPLELAMAAHDYLCENLYYDNAALSRYETYVNANGSSKNYNDFRIFVCAGAFLDSVGNGVVCEGYARAFKVLCDQFGIPCVLIGGKVVQNGKNIGHMWNGVQIEGKWYLTDPTWDDTSSGVSRKYFMIGNITSGRTSSGNFSGSANTRTFVYPALETEKLEYCQGGQGPKHDYRLVSATGVCEVSSISTYVCERCGDSYETEEVLEHNYKKKIVPPTCTSPGYTEYTCRYCGDTYHEGETDALGHSYVDGICSRCKGTDTIEHAALSSIAAQTYTGETITPAVTVSFGSNVLREGTDYTVTYRNNTNAGTAYATVTGKGNYRGTKSVSFRITQKSVAALTYTPISAQTYTGGAITPAVTVSFGSNVLKQGTDYTVAYRDNTNAGTAYVTVTGKGNYNGTQTFTFKIAQRSVAGLSYSAIAAQVYTGRTVTPAVTVKFGSTVLKRGSDYIIAFWDNTNVGTAHATVTGKGNYSGTKTLSFKITQRSVAGLSYTPIADQTYSGKAKTPAVTIKNGTVKLVKDRDYTVTYSRNKAIGTAAVTVRGKGSYSGTKKLTFRINPKPAKLKKLKSAKTKKMTAVWGKIAGIGGYQLQYSTDSGFAGAKTVKAGKGAVSKTVSKLKKGNTYYVRIRTWKKVSGKTYYSSWSAPKYVKVK